MAEASLSASGVPELVAFGGHMAFGVAVQGSWGLAKMPVEPLALLRMRAGWCQRSPGRSPARAG